MYHTEFILGLLFFLLYFLFGQQWMRTARASRVLQTVVAQHVSPL